MTFWKRYTLYVCKDCGWRGEKLTKMAVWRGVKSPPHTVGIANVDVCPSCMRAEPNIETIKNLTEGQLRLLL